MTGPRWRTRILFIFLAASCSLSSECRAQPQKLSENLARITLGLGLYNSGWYNCAYYYYPYYSCGSGGYSDYVPFTTGVQFDIHLAEKSYLTPGFQFMTGQINANYYNGVQNIENSHHVNLWEPTLDYVAKGDSDSDKITGRLRAGLAAYIGSDGHSGGGFRLGGGGSFFNTKKIGLGLDFVFEGGSYHGYWIGGLQLLASPEFHF
jgi:hypothetical protein